MPIIYRKACAEDLERADALVVACINDLTSRHGFGPVAESRPPQFQLFSLEDDPDGLWVAEEADRILGFAWSWACDDLWFLSQLFVSPDHQGRGIGGEMLKRMFDHAGKRGATNRVLITFSFNVVSQGLYIRNGIIPRFPIYNFSVSRERLASGAQSGQFRQMPLFHHVALENTASHLRSLAGIDAQVLGVSRDKHHKFLLSDSARRGFLFNSDGNDIGYAYISGGHVGPLAVSDPGFLGGVFDAALNLAAESGSAQVSAFIPGTSDVALKLAAERGMQITLPMLLMSTREFGNWDRYLPRNPGFV